MSGYSCPTLGAPLTAWLTSSAIQRADERAHHLPGPVQLTGGQPGRGQPGRPVGRGVLGERLQLGAARRGELEQRRAPMVGVGHRGRTAVVPPAARQLLSRFDQESAHYEVVVPADT